jgi:hypothetical protein
MSTQFSIAQGYGKATKPTPSIVAAPPKMVSPPYVPPTPGYRQPLTNVLETSSLPAEPLPLSGGTLLAMMELSCAQWMSMSRRDRFARLTGWVPRLVAPHAPGASERYYAYEDMVTRACSLRPSGEVPIGVTDPARFWKGTTIVASGVAVVLAWKLSRAGSRIRKADRAMAKVKR